LIKRVTPVARSSEESNSSIGVRRVTSALAASIEGISPKS
jgi:hypothetical protein